MTGNDFSLRLCETIAAWRYEDLPAPVLRMTKLCLADTLGVIGGAARTTGIAELNARIARWEAGGSATGLIGKRRFSPPSAALANATAAHALDYDDIHDTARVHSGCVVLPTVLACAEDMGMVSGRDFLLALAVGTEMHARLGLACHDSLSQGWHPTAIFGSMAGALAAAKLMQQDARRMCNALGIAYHQASGSAQSAYDGVLTKRLGPGFAARDAVMSAVLAADGLTGTPHSLEGKAGFFALYMQGRVRPGQMTEGLGNDWRIAEYSLKPYPACRCNHGAIALGIRLHDEGLDPASVSSVEIRMSEANWTLVGKPYDASIDSVVHAQFNAAYSFARALIDGRVGPRAYERPAIGETAVVALAAKVRVAVDDAVPKDAMAPVRIDLRLVDGRTLTLSGNTLKGSRDEPMSEREVQDKLRGCFEFGMDAPASAADRLADAIFTLEHASDAAAAIRAAFPGP